MNDDRLLTEPLLSLRELVRKMNVRRTYSTVRVWATKGSKGCTGRLVVLETIRIGGVRHSSLEAYRRFLKELAAPG